MKRYFFVFLLGFFFALLVTEALASEVKVGGEIRVRGESVSNGTTGTKDREQIIQRTRLNVDATIDEKTKAYIQLQDSRAWGSDGTSLGEGTETENPSTKPTIQETPATSTTTVTPESTDIKQAMFSL